MSTPCEVLLKFQQKLQTGNIMNQKNTFSKLEDVKANNVLQTFLPSSSNPSDRLRKTREMISDSQRIANESKLPANMTGVDLNKKCPDSDESLYRTTPQCYDNNSTVLKDSCSHFAALATECNDNNSTLLKDSFSHFAALATECNDNNSTVLKDTLLHFADSFFESQKQLFVKMIEACLTGMNSSVSGDQSPSLPMNAVVTSRKETTNVLLLKSTNSAQISNAGEAITGSSCSKETVLDQGILDHSIESESCAEGLTRNALEKACSSLSTMAAVEEKKCLRKVTSGRNIGRSHKIKKENSSGKEAKSSMGTQKYTTRSGRNVKAPTPFWFSGVPETDKVENPDVHLVAACEPRPKQRKHGKCEESVGFSEQGRGAKKKSVKPEIKRTIQGNNFQSCKVQEITKTVRQEDWNVNNYSEDKKRTIQGMNFQSCKVQLEKMSIQQEDRNDKNYSEDKRSTIQGKNFRSCKVQEEKKTIQEGDRNDNNYSENKRSTIQNYLDDHQRKNFQGCKVQDKKTMIRLEDGNDQNYSEDKRVCLGQKSCQSLSFQTECGIQAPRKAHPSSKTISFKNTEHVLRPKSGERKRPKTLPPAAQKKARKGRGQTFICYFKGENDDSWMEQSS